MQQVPMPPEPKATFAYRLESYIKNHEIFIIIALTASIIGSLGSIAGAIGNARNWYYQTFSWQDAEYEKIASLHAGINISVVADSLGSPVFVRTFPDGRHTERSFHRRDYWVQAVTDAAGSVDLLTVSACDASFQPPIHSPLGDVRLNVSSLADAFTVHAINRIAPYRIRFAPGADHPSDLFEEYPSGNPGFFKTYFVGVNGACPARSIGDAFRLFGDLRPEFDNDPESRGAVYGAKPHKAIFRGYDPGTLAPGLLEDFRRATVINSYAETGIFTDLEDDIGSIDGQDDAPFKIGVDSLLTRTVDSATYYPVPTLSPQCVQYLSSKNDKKCTDEVARRAEDEMKTVTLELTKAAAK